MSQPSLPPINPNQTEILSAPLVHLVDTDPRTLSAEQLVVYLKQIRDMRANASSRRSGTERAKKDGTMKSNLTSLL